MRETIDKGYNFLDESQEIIELLQVVSKKLTKFNFEIKSIEDLSAYYDLANVDLSHIVEGLGENKQVYEELVYAKHCALLKRRREIKDMKLILTNDMSVTKLNEILENINRCISWYEGKTEAFLNRTYTIRTAYGSSILKPILESGTKVSMGFDVENEKEKNLVSNVSKVKKAESLSGKQGKSYILKKQKSKWYIIDSNNHEKFSGSFEKAVKFIVCNVSATVEEIEVPKLQLNTFTALYKKYQSERVKNRK